MFYEKIKLQNFLNYHSDSANPLTLVFDAWKSSAMFLRLAPTVAQ